MMIGGCVHGGGGAALGLHNANTAHNDEVRLGESRGLLSWGIKGQIAELSELAAASGHKTPIRHAFASPPPDAEWGETEWSTYWSLYERAQGLEECPFSEAIHSKPGHHDRPEHVHRVYLAITKRGTLVRNGNDYIKQEAVSRISEFDTAAPFVKGRHNVRAEREARRLGRDDVADAMIAAGLLDGTRAIAALSPQARAQQERTGINKIDVARSVATAWAASDNQQAFAAALKDAGLMLARGDKKEIPVVLDASGNVHGLTKMLQMHARGEGVPSPKAVEINARIDMSHLPTVAEARGGMKDEAQSPTISSLYIQSGPPNPPSGNAKHCAEQAELPQGERQPSSQEKQSLASCTGGGIGGGGPLSASSAAASSQAADLGFHAATLEGPGDPPGLGAGPEEITRYRLKLALYEEKRGAQRTAQAKALQAANDKSGGDAHGSVQSETPTQTKAIESPRFQDEVATAIEWHHDRSGRNGPSDSGRDQGRAPHGPDSREHLGAASAADRRGEWSLAGGENPAGGDMHEAGCDGRQAFNHRVATARAVTALGSLKIASLLEMLEPERVARKLIESERVRIARRRAEVPFYNPLARDADHSVRAIKSTLFAPLHVAQDALKDELARLEAVSPIPWQARFVPWKTAPEREKARAQEAVVIAHAAVSAVTPSWDEVDNAVHLARVRADNAARVYETWQRAEGQVLDRCEHLLGGIINAIQCGDVEMRRAVMDDGMDAAIRLQSEREARAVQEQRSQMEETNVVGFMPR